MWLEEHLDRLRNWIPAHFRSASAQAQTKRRMASILASAVYEGCAIHRLPKALQACSCAATFCPDRRALPTPFGAPAG